MIDEEEEEDEEDVVEEEKEEEEEKEDEDEDEDEIDVVCTWSVGEDEGCGSVFRRRNLDIPDRMDYE